MPKHTLFFCLLQALKVKKVFFYLFFFLDSFFLFFFLTSFFDFLFDKGFRENVCKSLIINDLGEPRPPRLVTR